MTTIISVCIILWLAKAIVQIVRGSFQILAYPLMMLLGVAVYILAYTLEIFTSLWKTALGICDN